MGKNVEVVEEKLGLNKSSDPLENVTEEILKTSAKMFSYLNYCPARISLFYKKLFKISSSREIVLSLASILKTSKGLEKQIVQEIWSKVTETLEILNYKTIQGT